MQESGLIKFLSKHSNLRWIFTHGNDLQLEQAVMFEGATVMAMEGATLTVTINTNIIEDVIFLDVVDKTAVLDSKFKSTPAYTALA